MAAAAAATILVTSTIVIIINNHRAHILLLYYNFIANDSSVVAFHKRGMCVCVCESSSLHIYRSFRFDCIGTLGGSKGDFLFYFYFVNGEMNCWE